MKYEPITDNLGRKTKASTLANCADLIHMLRSSNRPITNTQIKTHLGLSTTRIFNLWAAMERLYPYVNIDITLTHNSLIKHRMLTDECRARLNRMHYEVVATPVFSELPAQSEYYQQVIVRFNLIADIMNDHPTGLTQFEIAEIAGITRAEVARAFRSTGFEYTTVRLSKERRNVKYCLGKYIGTRSSRFHVAVAKPVKPVKVDSKQSPFQAMKLMHCKSI